VSAPAVYSRISQDREGTEVGVDNQRAAAVALLKQHGVAPPHPSREYADNNRGASSKSRKSRPDFERLLTDARAGLVTDIAAYSWSRLTRRPLELELLIELAEKHGVTFHIVTGSNIDLGTPEGRAIARTVAAWDAAEAERTGERVAFAQASKLAKGEDIGGPRPFGFEKDRRTLRPAEAEAVRAAYESILAGESVWSIAKRWDVMGLKRDRSPLGGWRPQTVRHILLRERNAGRLVIKGVTHSTELPQLVEPDVFDAVRAVLTNPARTPRRGPKSRSWAAIGSVKCAVCGSYVSQTGAARSGRRDIRCSPDSRPMASRSERHPTVSAEKLERQLAVLVHVELTRRHLTGEEFTSHGSRIPALQLEVTELVRQRDLAQELAFAPGANKAAALAKITRLGARIDALQHELDEAQAGDVATRALAVAAAEFERISALGDPGTDDESETGDEYQLTAWIEHWDGLPVEDRKALVLGLLPGARMVMSGALIDGWRVTYDGFLTPAA
jgi:site-specific DNA recombinase